MKTSITSLNFILLYIFFFVITNNVLKIFQLPKYLRHWCAVLKYFRCSQIRIFVLFVFIAILIIIYRTLVEPKVKTNTAIISYSATSVYVCKLKILTLTCMGNNLSALYTLFRLEIIMSGDNYKPDYRVRSIVDVVVIVVHHYRPVILCAMCHTTDV